jgi:hypothetical protein
MLPTGRLVPVRLLRALVLVELGAWAGMVTAAAIVRRAVPSRGDEDSDELALMAVFDGVDLSNRARAFRGGSMFAWFGGISVDLREATLADDATLTVGALFGGVDVKVPTGWRVETSGRAFFGGVADVLTPPDDPTAPTLTVTSTAVFGGVSIRHADAPAAAAA